MSLGRCIPELGHNGQLTPEEAAKVRRQYDDHFGDLSKSMSPAAAEAEASKRTIAALEVEHAERFRRAGLQVKAQQFAEDWLTRGGDRFGGGDRGGGPDGPGGPLPGEGPQGPVNPKAATTLMKLLEARHKAVEGQAFGKVSALLEQHRKTMTGKLRRPAEMDEIGRAAFGEEVDSVSAKELAQAVADVQEWLRLRANAAGANIGKLENRGFATHHDSRAVAEAGFDAWYAAERPRWDVDRMVDEETGQPFTEARLQTVARDVFQTIASDGFSKVAPGSAGRSSFANRMGQHRFIHYRNYDAWKESQAQFGRGTAFDALLGEVKGMSRAIAAMEILGPNPEATVRYVGDRVRGDQTLFEPGQLRKRDKAAAEAIRVKDLWGEYTGALRQPENRNVALAFSAYRAIAASAKLGSAAETAIGDIGFGTATRKFNGLPVAGIVRDYLKLLNPADASDRRLAAQLSFVPEVWTSHVSGTHRFLAEELTGEVSSRIADGVLRASGLTAITDAGRQAHGLVTFIHLTNTRHQAFNELEPAWAAALERYRIGAKEWDAIRSAEPDPEIDIVRPEAIADRELRDRFLEMAHSEQDFAVPVPDLETRATLNKHARKGTIIGELLRSSPLMFRTFTISSMLRHGGRMVDQSGAAGKAGYLVSVLIPVTVMGVIAYELKEVTKGRQPRSLADPATWGNGLVTGGGLGIAGDLLNITAEHRFKGTAEFVVGPLAQDFDALSSAGFAVGKNAAIDAGLSDAERDPRANWQAFRAVRNDVPGQNLWYARLAIDRLLADQVQAQIDPEYRSSWRQMERRAADQGQDLWWKPGESSPERPPDLAQAFRGDEK